MISRARAAIIAVVALVLAAVMAIIIVNYQKIKAVLLPLVGAAPGNGDDSDSDDDTEPPTITEPQSYDTPIILSAGEILISTQSALGTWSIVNRETNERLPSEYYVFEGPDNTWSALIPAGLYSFKTDSTVTISASLKDTVGKSIYIQVTTMLFANFTVV